MKHFKVKYKAAIALFLITFSCNKPKDAFPVFVQDDKVTGKYKNGILIANEGNFGWGYGTLSFYQKDNKTVEHEIFRLVNNRILGNVVQSVARMDTFVYIVVNNSKKIEIASALTMKSVGSIYDLVSPRYLVFLNNKAYCTDLYSGYISIIENNKPTQKIATGSWTERMVVFEDKIFVEDRSGFILVLKQDAVSQKIKTNGTPYGLALWNNRIWTIANDSLWSIDPQNERVENKFAMPKSPNRARIVIASGQPLWILFGDIWKFDGNSFQRFFNGSNKNLYALSATNNLLAFADAKDYVSASQVYLYESELALDTFEGGVIAGEIDLNFF